MIDEAHQSDLLHLIDEQKTGRHGAGPLPAYAPQEAASHSAAQQAVPEGVAYVSVPAEGEAYAPSYQEEAPADGEGHYQQAPAFAHTEAFSDTEPFPAEQDLFAGAEPPPGEDNLFAGAQAPLQEAGLFAGAEAPPQEEELFGGAAVAPAAGAAFAATHAPAADHPRRSHQSHQWQQHPARPEAHAAPPMAAEPAPYPQQYGQQGGVAAFDDGDTRMMQANRSPAYMQQNEPGRVAVPKRQPAAPPPIDLPEPEPIKKRSVGGTIVMFFVIVVVFAVVFTGTILTMLYFQNRPSGVVDDFAEAVSAADVQKLQDMVTVEGVVPTNEQWLAFCAAFKQRASLNTLKSQLLLLAENPEAQNLTYPAVTIESKPFILFIDRYKIKISAVDLLVPGAVQGTVLRLDTTDYQGAPAEGGLLFSGLMPGQYQCRVAPPGTDPASVEPFTTEFFGVGAPNVLEGSQPTATVTIDNCISDDASIYINDAPSNERPVGGVVVLPNVPLGATIRIQAVVDGVLKESNVVFADLSQASLRFENYADVSGEGTPAPAESQAPSSQAAVTQEISVDEAGKLLTTFYQSYLQCINDQKMDAIKVSTASNNEALAKRIKSEANAANLFEFVSASIDASTFKLDTRDGVPIATFTATFKYKYKPRAGGADLMDASNQQVVELVYVDGQWLVNKMEFPK